ncbi:hypothetical protein Vi05172_g12102 [Venturia inaequalis]|nr:hypothetical protein Vi05172_g12102 [Venturia inaequalis]
MHHHPFFASPNDISTINWLACSLLKLPYEAIREVISQLHTAAASGNSLNTGQQDRQLNGFGVPHVDRPNLF